MVYGVWCMVYVVWCMLYIIHVSYDTYIIECIIDTYIIPREPSILQQGESPAFSSRVCIHLYGKVCIYMCSVWYKYCSGRVPHFWRLPTAMECVVYLECVVNMYIYTIYIYHIEHIYYTEPIHIYTHLSTITGVQNFPWARNRRNTYIWWNIHI